MKNRFAQLAIALGLVGATSLVPTVQASPVIHSNLAVNGLMAAASRPGTGSFEIETADDFVLTQTTRVDHATFISLLPSGASLGSITQIRLEIYRVPERFEHRPLAVGAHAREFAVGRGVRRARLDGLAIELLRDG